MTRGLLVQDFGVVTDSVTYSAIAERCVCRNHGVTKAFASMDEPESSCGLSHLEYKQMDARESKKVGAMRMVGGG